MSTLGDVQYMGDIMIHVGDMTKLIKHSSWTRQNKRIRMTELQLS